MKPQTLLRLYPRPWRERYGDEFLALLEKEGTSARVVMSVLAGAFDAWISRRSFHRMAAKQPIGPQVIWTKTDTTTGRYESDFWVYLLVAMGIGLLVHGIGQMIHPGRMFPISFLAGFMATWQLWLFRQFSARTAAAAAFWVFLFGTGGVWLIHFSLHRFVYPWFAQ